MHTHNLEHVIPTFMWVLLGIGLFGVIWLGIYALFAINKEDDPYYACEVYKDIGCAHLDGRFCCMDTCGILHNHRMKKSQADGDQWPPEVIEKYKDVKV